MTMDDRRRLTASWFKPGLPGEAVAQSLRAPLGAVFDVPPNDAAFDDVLARLVPEPTPPSMAEPREAA